MKSSYSVSENLWLPPEKEEIALPLFNVNSTMKSIVKTALKLVGVAGGT